MKQFKSFVFPETTKKQIDAMPSEMQLKFYIAVTNYGMYGIEPEDLSDIEFLIWIPMKDLIDSSKNNRGGAPEGNKNAERTTKDNSESEKQPKTTETTLNNENNRNNPKTTETTLNNGNENGNDKVNVKENGNGNSEESGADAPTTTKSLKRFVKPTLKDIQDYCSERNNGINAQNFFDYYESKGWKVGQTPMKDWKAAVRTWECRENTQRGYSPPTQNRTLPPDRLTL